MIYELVYLVGFCFTVGLCLATQTKQYIDKNTGIILAAGIIWPVFLPTVVFGYIFKKLGNK